MLLKLAIILVASCVSMTQQQPPPPQPSPPPPQLPLSPNHVSLNEKAKHIDVDSSWLDKTGQKVQQVHHRTIFSTQIRLMRI